MVQRTFPGAYSRRYVVLLSDYSTVILLSIGTDRFEQTMQTQIRLLQREQSDQGLHCLTFNLHLFGDITALKNQIIPILGQLQYMYYFSCPSIEL